MIAPDIPLPYTESVHPHLVLAKTEHMFYNKGPRRCGHGER